ASGDAARLAGRGGRRPDLLRREAGRGAAGPRGGRGRERGRGLSRKWFGGPGGHYVAAVHLCINTIPGGRYPMWNNIKDTIRRIQRFASTPFRMVVILTAILFVIGWLMGYLRLLDAFLGVELPVWVQVPGIVAVVAGAALGLTCGGMLS